MVLLGGDYNMGFTRRVPQVIVKPSDETVNNSSALQADDNFTFNVEAGKKYRVRANLMTTGTVAVAGFKMALSGTATVTAMRVQARIFNESSGVSQTGAQWSALDTSLGILIAAASNYYAYFNGILEINTAGTIILQWAQNTANASDTKLKQDSHMELMEI